MRSVLRTLGLFVFTCLAGGLAGPTQQVCDPGWVAYNDWCYLFHVGRPIQWASARDECNRLDSSLLRVYSAGDITWITNTAKANYSAMGFWTALNDNSKESAVRYGTGHWKWGSFEPADMTIIKWSQSPTMDGVSNCGGLTLQGKASNIICSARQGFICSLPTVGCPLGWLPTDHGCYWVSNTTDDSQLLTWNDAMNWCKNNAQGASLMTINNSSDVDFITNHLPYIAKTTKLHWIGLSFNTNTKQWGWYNNAPYNPSLITWTTEPDNLAGMENCGVLRLTGTFSDRDCTSKSNYICFKTQYSATPVNNHGCGNYIRAGTQCYSFQRNVRATWQGARSYCQKNGGDLIKVDSFDKQTWLTQQLIDPTNNFVFWTGLNDISKEGKYVWLDGSPANQSYIKWNQEPNDYKGNEDCALIYATGQYNDVICSTHAAAICELTGAGSCPTNMPWVSNGGSCYLFTPYTNVTLLYTQREASSYCYTFALNSTVVGALVSINSPTEGAFIKTQLASLPDNVYGWWTSLNDKQTEGFWQFGDNSYDPSFVSWTGEPSTAPKDDCGLVNYGGAFHERDCSKKLHFICEKYAVGFSDGPLTKAVSIYTLSAVILSILLR